MFRVSVLSAVSAAVMTAFAPALAHAGTSTGTGTAEFNVVNQCSITGAIINLGTFTTSNTWSDVFAIHGYIREGDGEGIQGSLGWTGVNWGSVTCDSGTPYTLFVKGRGTDWGQPTVTFAINGKRMNAWPMIKKVGDIDVPDAWWVMTAGNGGDGTEGVAGVGTGAPQAVLGHIWFHPEWFMAPDVALSTDTLGAAGSFVAPLDYTLNF